jgi:hypothetical protein
VRDRADLDVTHARHPSKLRRAWGTDGQTPSR